MFKVICCQVNIYHPAKIAKGLKREINIITTVEVKEIESLIKLLDDPDFEISNHVEEKLLSY